MNVSFNLAPALKELGWLRSDLADRLGIHRNTIAAWPEDKVPKYVAAYLGLALRINRFSKEL